MPPLAETPPPVGEPPPDDTAEARGLMQDADENDFQDTDMLLDRAREVMFGGSTQEGEASGSIVKMLQNAASVEPVMVLAQTAAVVVNRAITGMQPPPDGASAFYVLTETIGDLATIAANEGIFDYRQEEIEAALPKAADDLNMQTRGKTFPQSEMAAEADVIKGASNDLQFNNDLAMIAAEAGETMPTGGM